MVQQVAARVDRFAQVVRRDVRGHTDGNTGRAVHEKVRQTRGQHRGFFFGVVEVGHEVDRVLFEVVEHCVGNARQAAFRVTHGRRAVAVDRAEVALAPDERVAHRKVLRQTHEGLVDGQVAVRMVLTDHVADDAGALFGGVRKVVAELVHGKEHAPVHGLEAVAHVRQGAPHDHAHGVVEIRALHFAFERNGQRLERIGNRHAVGFAVGPAGGALCAFLRARLVVELVFVVLVHVTLEKRTPRRPMRPCRAHGRVSGCLKRMGKPRGPSGPARRIRDILPSRMPLKALKGLPKPGL